MAFIQMSVPLVFWGQRPPSHDITCICRTEDKKVCTFSHVTLIERSDWPPLTPGHGDRVEDRSDMSLGHFERKRFRET